MPTQEQYESALNAAHQAGDGEGVIYFSRKLREAIQRPREYTADTGFFARGNILDKALEGVTFGFSDELAGLGGGIGTALMHGDFSRGYTYVRDRMRQRQKEYAKEYPTRALVGELAGGLAVPGSVFRAAGKGAAKQGAVLGGAYGLGKAEAGDPEQEYAGLGDIAKSTGIGAAGGALVGKALEGAGQFLGNRFSFPGRQNPYYQEQVQTLRGANIPVTQGERLGDPAVKMAESQLRRSPITGMFGMTQGGLQRRHQQFMSQLMGRAGFTPQDAAAGFLNPRSVQRAQQRFNREYDNVLRNVAVRLDEPAVSAELNVLAYRHGQLLPQAQRRSLERAVDEFRDVAFRRQRISGREYKTYRSKLGKQAAQLSRSATDNHLAPFYRDLKYTLDRAFQAAAGPRRAEVLRDIDSRYGNFLVLKQGANKKGEAIQTMVTQAQNRGEAVSDDFMALLDAYNDVIVRGLQTSGTAENLALGGFIPNPGAIAHKGLAYGAEAVQALPSVLPQGAAGATLAAQTPEHLDLESLYGRLTE